MWSLQLCVLAMGLLEHALNVLMRTNRLSLAEWMFWTLGARPSLLAGFLPPFLPSLCVAQARFSQLGWHWLPSKNTAARFLHRFMSFHKAFKGITTTFEGGDEENIHILKKKNQQKSKIGGASDDVKGGERSQSSRSICSAPFPLRSRPGGVLGGGCGVMGQPYSQRVGRWGRVGKVVLSKEKEAELGQNGVFHLQGGLCKQ